MCVFNSLRPLEQARASSIARLDDFSWPVQAELRVIEDSKKDYPNDSALSAR